MSLDYIEALITREEPLIIRPSGVSAFMSCPKKYAASNLMGYKGWGSFATVRGTGVHASAEAIWNESIKAQSKIINITQAQDAAVESVEKAFENEDIRLDDENFESKAGVKDAAAEGALIYCEMAKEIEIPAYVEHTMQIDLGDNIIVKGTADFISADGRIEDIKTSSKKATTSQYTAQLSVYARLAELNDIKVDTENSRIQNVAFLKNKVEGHLLSFKLNQKMASYLINTIKERTILARQNPYEIDLLFPANPSSYLCSPKYCAYYDDCEAHG